MGFWDAVIRYKCTIDNLLSILCCATLYRKSMLGVGAERKCITSVRSLFDQGRVSRAIRRLLFELWMSTWHPHFIVVCHFFAVGQESPPHHLLCMRSWDATPKCGRVSIFPGSSSSSSTAISSAFAGSSVMRDADLVTRNIHKTTRIKTGHQSRDLAHGHACRSLTISSAISTIISSWPPTILRRPASVRIARVSTP
jgi:hypothetical protein